MRSMVEGPSAQREVRPSASLRAPPPRSARFPSPRRAGGGFVLLALTFSLAGCDREARESRGEPLPETVPFVATSTLYPGAPRTPAPDPRAKLYAGNAYHVSQGQRLFGWMNCVGCHSHGGGGMGPALMDEDWLYGGSMEQIVASIAQGRPNGMPSWQGKLTEQQMWQLAAYVKSLSGEAPQDALSARADEKSGLEPPTLKEANESGPGAAGVPAR